MTADFGLVVELPPNIFYGVWGTLYDLKRSLEDGELLLTLTPPSESNRAHGQAQVKLTIKPGRMGLQVMKVPLR